MCPLDLGLRWPCTGLAQVVVVYMRAEDSTAAMSVVSCLCPRGCWLPGRATSLPVADPCAAHQSTTVACGLWQSGPGDAATCETSWRVALCHGNARLHCKDVMGCEGTRCARWEKE